MILKNSQGNPATLRIQRADETTGAIELQDFPINDPSSPDYAGAVTSLVVEGSAGNDRITIDPAVTKMLPIARVTVNAGAGDDYVDFGGIDPARSHLTNTVLNGGDGADTLLGTLAGALIDAGAGDDVLAAYGGNDELHGGQGDDTLYAGAGNDTPFGESGNDQRFLGRTPDAAGMAYWVDQMQHHGLTDEALEAGFIGSAEFYRHAGGADRLWVDAKYQDLLGRQPDADGEVYRVRQLAQGASRSSVAFGFAASLERERQRILAKITSTISAGCPTCRDSTSGSADLSPA